MPKIFVGESFTVALLSGTEKVWRRGGGGGGVSRFSVETFLSHSAENFRRESFTVALISGTQKVWRRGGCHDFPSEVFRLTVPKNFVGEPFFVSQNFWYRKNLWIRGGGEYHDFLSKIFVSECRKILEGNPSVFHYFRVSNFFLLQRVMSR